MSNRDLQSPQSRLAESEKQLRLAREALFERDREAIDDVDRILTELKTVLDTIEDRETTSDEAREEAETDERKEMSRPR